ncbi:MAG: hypothetical protein ACRD1H_00520 [Vicinamibacterales bacterium]
MMRAILGSAIGGLVAGAVALVATAQGRAPEAVWPNAAETNTPYAMTVADTRGMNSASTTSPTLVQCEPHQEAVLQRSLVANREVAQVTCVTRMAPQAAYAPAPAPYYPAAYAQPDIVQRPVVRTQTVRPQRVVYRQAEEVKPRRSWKKTALVIGGSAGAGAGVGALAGGKKGALIGAAIGGGAASIYEAVKRN